MEQLMFKLLVVRMTIANGAPVAGERFRSFGDSAIIAVCSFLCLGQHSDVSQRGSTIAWMCTCSATTQ